MFRRLLLGCGVLSSLTYLAADISGALVWDGYSYVDQTVSELAALGTPSRPIVLPIFMAYNILVLVFAAGAASYFEDHRLRKSSWCLAGIAVLGIVSGLFPIEQRSAGPINFNGTVHIALVGATVILIVMAMAFGARLAGQRFYLYTIATIVVTLLSGVIAGFFGGRMAANLPTPFMGVAERVSIFSYLAWVAVLAAVLLQTPSPHRQALLRGHFAGH
jgi:hypothetical protein